MTPKVPNEADSFFGILVHNHVTVSKHKKIAAVIKDFLVRTCKYLCASMYVLCYTIVGRAKKNAMPKSFLLFIQVNEIHGSDDTLIN